MKTIETCGLTKFYGKSRGIVDLDLSVDEGEFFEFIGSNGAGKSTTIRILLGLVRADGGSASVLGKDIAGEKSALLEPDLEEIFLHYYQNREEKAWL